MFVEQITVSQPRERVWAGTIQEKASHSSVVDHSGVAIFVVEGLRGFRVDVLLFVAEEVWFN